MNAPCIYNRSSTPIGDCALRVTPGPSLGFCLTCAHYSGPDRTAMLAEVCQRREPPPWTPRPFWIGKPWPLRLRLRWAFPFVYVKRLPGCGCLTPAKFAVWQFRFWWRYTWQLH